MAVPASNVFVIMFVTFCAVLHELCFKIRKVKVKGKGKVVPVLD